MLIGEARAVATQWVRQHGSRRADFRGAFFSGSTTALPEDSLLPPTSDVDVVILLAGAETPLKPGKFLHRGVLLEVTYLAAASLADTDRVAASYHLAHSFSRDNIISDPTGQLRRLHHAIAPTFDHPASVERRCGDVIAKIERGLSALDATAPWHDQITRWMFPTAVTTHLILVAARQNPTVRLRYLAARNALQRHGLIRLYPPLLDLLGCREVAPAQVQRHLDTLAAVFDTAAACARTPFFFSSDITGAARPIAIDASQALIDAGDHREAVFWIIATHARCQMILAADAPGDVQDELAPVFREAAADLLGVRDTSDLLRRAAAVREFLPTLKLAARTIAGPPVDAS